eukprot:TRINITY_DN18608_c0_g5_i2.p1 TRINITY_DN18608_c0_g5~~TRINITY_DN18608_c0_g5_i2.p1  ORF type:complete len:600 (+),score=108.57 TRINITY_DN18608_c0_g5_i2:77-1876(+)
MNACGVFGVVLALALARILYSPCQRRLWRNIALSGVPEPPAMTYAQCTDRELIEAVSLVVTVKDTCSQAELLLRHLAQIYPRDMHVIYAYPDIRGCRHVPAENVTSRLFPNSITLAVGRADAPIAGFLKAQPHLKTKYAVLMHNDAYPLERDFACQLYRGLEAHPEYPIAAPQIYETAGKGIIVPHGHHQNLHLRSSPSSETKNGLRIDYDLSMNLLTQRLPDDFREGPQVDFLEDHAFFARTAVYHELLDPAGSFTLEYMDMILNMRARNTSAWYVPSARCVFEVDTELITWEDLPYLVYKRSEQVGHQVRTYLTNKWGVEFVNTGIWNYVRYVMLAEVVLDKDKLPTSWADQAAIFYSWFESAGFNRYDGQYLPDFVEDPPESNASVRISRTQRLTLPTEVPEHRIPPKAAENILHVHEKSKAIEISFDEPHLPIGIRRRACDAAEASSYADCGLAVQVGDTCQCYTYVAPFNLRTTFYLDKVAALMKLPSRAFMYAQMKYWPKPIDSKTVDIYCGPHQEDCSTEVVFPKGAKVLQWSWFGQQRAYPVTPEGALFATTVLLVLLGTALRRNPIWVTKKMRRFRAFGVIQALCGSISS